MLKADNKQNKLQYNWEITGHERQLEKLEQNIAEDNVTHAYLFTGAKHIGKTSIAKKFAQILQCENNCCSTCKTCKLIGYGNHEDTFICDEEEESLSIESMRKYQEIFSRTGESKYRILIVPDAERLSFAAQNAVLKFLEEPTQKTICILTSSRPQLLLETIHSRVRSIYFTVPKISEKELREDEGSNLSLFLAQERIGLYKTLKENKEVQDKDEELFSITKDVFSGKNIAKRFKYAEKIGEEKVRALRFLEIMQFYLRAQFRMIHRYENILEPGYLDQEKQIALIHTIDTSIDLIAKNVNKRLVLENLLLSF